MSKTKFDKPAHTVKQHIELLKSKGLVIADETAAADYIQKIGYYRLFCVYSMPFQQKVKGSQDTTFQPGTQFDDVLDVYVFDRKLRILVMDAVERIEVAIRVAISNHMSLKYSPHWFYDANCFYPAKFQVEFLKEADDKTARQAAPGSVAHNKRDHFIQCYFDNHDDPQLPPSWMLTEVLSCGTWSKCYGALKRDDQIVIAKEFGVHHEVFKTWIHALTVTRNLCAHHSRLWNRNFAIRPEPLKVVAKEFEPVSRFVAQAAMIHLLLKVVSPQSEWTKRLKSLLQEHPRIPIAAMGFKPDWFRNIFWGIQELA